MEEKEFMCVLEYNSLVKKANNLDTGAPILVIDIVTFT